MPHPSTEPTAPEPFPHEQIILRLHRDVEPMGESEGPPPQSRSSADQEADVLFEASLQHGIVEARRAADVIAGRTPPLLLDLGGDREELHVYTHMHLRSNAEVLALLHGALGALSVRAAVQQAALLHAEAAQRSEVHAAVEGAETARILRAARRALAQAEGAADDADDWVDLLETSRVELHRCLIVNDPSTPRPAFRPAHGPGYVRGLLSSAYTAVAMAALDEGQLLAHDLRRVPALTPLLRRITRARASQLSWAGRTVAALGRPYSDDRR